MTLQYTAFSTFDATCCGSITLDITETRSWDANVETTTGISSNGSALVLQITTVGADKDLPLDPGALNSHFVYHTISNLTNVNGCNLPAELVNGGIITYQFDVPDTEVQSCTCTIASPTITATFACV
jgi:hypothetical protein